MIWLAARCMLSSIDASSCSMSSRMRFSSVKRLSIRISFKRSISSGSFATSALARTRSFGIMESGSFFFV